MADVAASQSPHTCPGCSTTPMEGFGLAPSEERPAGSRVFGCRRCGGVWVDAATLETLLASAAAQATASSTNPGAAKRRTMASTKIVYRRCAVCSQQMQRRNFARVSGVIVDECRNDGSFFDSGELEDVLAFVRSGGLALAAQRDADERARQARQRAAVPAPTPMMRHYGGEPTDFTTDVDPIGAFVSWATRWVTGR